jgi:hypothetical protein
MARLISLLNETIQFVYYSNKKRFVIKYEENTRNYDKRTPPTLLATKKYLDAVTEIEIYEDLTGLNKPKSNIVTSVGTINLSTGKKTSLQRIK